MKSLFAWLKALPLISFAMLLGAGFVTTILAAWIICVLAYSPWPASAAEARIRVLGIALWILLGLVGLVMVVLGFGRIDKLSISGGVVSGSIDFADGEANGRMTIAADTSPAPPPSSPS